MINKKEIREKIDEILKIYEDDEIRFGGYTATKRLHLDAPEDYVEYRTDWLSLQNHADEMYYMLSDINNLLEALKKAIDG